MLIIRLRRALGLPTVLDRRKGFTTIEAIAHTWSHSVRGLDDFMDAWSAVKAASDLQAEVEDYRNAVIAEQDSAKPLPLDQPEGREDFDRIPVRSTDMQQVGDPEFDEEDEVDFTEVIHGAVRALHHIDWIREEALDQPLSRHFRTNSRRKRTKGLHLLTEHGRSLEWSDEDMARDPKPSTLLRGAPTSCGKVAIHRFHRWRVRPTTTRPSTYTPSTSWFLMTCTTSCGTSTQEPPTSGKMTLWSIILSHQALKKSVVRVGSESVKLHLEVSQLSYCKGPTMLQGRSVMYGLILSQMHGLWRWRGFRTSSSLPPPSSCSEEKVLWCEMICNVCYMLQGTRVKLWSKDFSIRMYYIELYNVKEYNRL